MIRNVLADIADENKDVFVFRVDVMMLPLPPLRLVEHLGKNQRGAHRVQYLSAIQNLIRRRQSRDVNIDEKFSRPPFGHNSRTELIAPSGDRCDADFRVFFLKQLHDPAKLAFSLIEIERELALALGALNGFLPFRLPVLLRFGRGTISRRRAAKEPDEQARR